MSRGPAPKVHFDALVPYIPGPEAGGQGELARRVGLSRRTISRYKRAGLVSEDRADDLAVACEEHPALLWPEMYGSPDREWEKSIIMPGTCAQCGDPVVLVRCGTRAGVRWARRDTRRMCHHPNR